TAELGTLPILGSAYGTPHTSSPVSGKPLGAFPSSNPSHGGSAATEFMKAIKVCSRSLLYLQHYFRSSLPSASDKNKFVTLRCVQQNSPTLCRLFPPPQY